MTSVDVPDLDAVNLDNPKKLKFKWTATDANEDELTYRLYVRKDGWKNWVQLEDDLDKTDYEWDTTTTPSGIYQLKVVASDRKDNPAADALTGERISAPFAVAHVPPTVTVKVAGPCATANRPAYAALRPYRGDGDRSAGAFDLGLVLRSTARNGRTSSRTTACSTASRRRFDSRRIA